MANSGRVLLLILVKLYYLHLVDGRSNGPPQCTLSPHHHGHAHTTNWQMKYEVKLYRINQDMLLDPYNKTGTVSPDPTGLYVLIRSVPNGYQQRSTFKGVAIQFNPSDRLVEFPLIHRNRKLKQLHCPYGEIMLSHKDPSSKYRVGFFIKGNLDYVYNGVKRFSATIVENYSQYYTNIVF